MYAYLPYAFRCGERSHFFLTGFYENGLICGYKNILLIEAMLEMGCKT
jgi:hypothetical protein